VESSLPDRNTAPFAIDRALSLLAQPWHFAREYKALSAEDIRALLPEIAAIADGQKDPPKGSYRDPRAEAIILYVMVGAAPSDDVLTERWQKAVEVLRELNLSYGWGSKKLRERLAALAKRPDVLAALQTAAVGGDQRRLRRRGKVLASDHSVSATILAVLCADGSATSVDALMPHFDRAERDGDRLKTLLRLRSHANPDSELVTSLLDTAKRRLDALSADSPAAALAKQIGFGRLKVFWFNVRISSTTLTSGNVPLYQGSVRVDSRAGSEWYSVWLTCLARSADRDTTFGSARDDRDGLALGRCSAAELPKWLRETQKKLSMTFGYHLSTHLRGKKKTALLAWLSGES
jgi:hypothetical protein